MLTEECVVTIGLFLSRLIVGLGGAGVIAACHICEKYHRIPYCNIKTKLYKDIIDNSTLIAKHYLPELHIKLKDSETSNKYSLEDLVKRGIRRFITKGNKETGIVIGDEECYEVFRELIDPVIIDLHGVHDIRGNQTASFKASDWRRIKGGRLVDKKVLSCVLSTSRNITGHPFPCALSNEEREEIARRLVRTLISLPGINIVGGL
jgi:creatine kinase